MLREKFNPNIIETINRLGKNAAADKDYATSIFLQWYVTEQIEEEANCQDAIDALKMIGDDKAAFYMYDSKLASR